jgi:molybdenum cofactor biosynthesis enzyme MoaA
MSIGTVAEIVRWTAESTIEEITLLGGEPAMHPDFVAIVALIKAAGLAVRTVTNGSSKFRAAMTHGPTSAAMDRVAVSLDVPNPELFDQLRGRGAFKDAMRTIELLALARKQFDINFTVVKSALPYVRQMLRFAEDLVLCKNVGFSLRAFDAGEDLVGVLGPGKRDGVVVPAIDERADGGGEFLD